MGPRSPDSDKAVKRWKLEIEEANQRKKLEIKAANANIKAKRGGASFHDHGLEQDATKKKKLVREEAKRNCSSLMIELWPRAPLFCMPTCVPA